jgi:hypothetical protein
VYSGKEDIWESIDSGIVYRKSGSLGIKWTATKCKVLREILITDRIFPSAYNFILRYHGGTWVLWKIEAHIWRDIKRYIK